MGEAHNSLLENLVANYRKVELPFLKTRIIEVSTLFHNDSNYLAENLF